MLYHGYSEIAITVALKTAEEVMVHASGTTPSPSPARPRHFTPSRSPLRLESTADSIGTNESSLEEVKDEIKDSAWLALPGLFWVWVVYNFYQYGVEHGFVF